MEVNSMERIALVKLVEWKNDEHRKPLIIKGARQVGKTWLMKEFGRRYYNNYVYFNFDAEEELATIFDGNKNPNRIVELLGFLSGRKIIPGETLIILDEIQECSSALNALKYFYENANEYHVIVAGSLLGTLLAQPKSYPVGMVNLLTLGPLSFGEFLNAVNPNLYQYYLGINNTTVIEEIFHRKLLEVYDYYLIIGGMPESVESWIQYKDPEKIETIQQELIDIYENDFAKHNGKVNSGRILMVFRSIVSQLAKDNEKFIYGCVRAGARAREFEDAIEWLVSAGMINRVYNVSKPEHPLAAYRQMGGFKLFVFDTGLLKKMAGIDNAAILIKTDFQFKGALTENFILQQLNNQFQVDPHYFANKQGEIDFVVQRGVDIVPIEVKAGEDKSAPSFKGYIQEREPKMAVRFSRRGYKKEENMVNVPLYLASKLCELI